MNMSVGRPEIGQWYAPTDKGELFQVVGRDEPSRTTEGAPAEPFSAETPEATEKAG